MANTKVTQHVISDDAITTSMITDGNVTVAKLPSTVDLSSKTLTLPSAAVGTTQSASDNSTKLATTAYVTTAVSNLIDSAPDTMNTLNEIAAALNDDADFNTTVTNSIAAKLPLAGGTMTGDLILGDNVKLEVGAASGGDLQIYHDGSNSYIKDDGTGNLFIQGGPAVVIEDTSGNNMAYFGDGGEVILYHNHAAKFETTAYGASTSGTGAFKLPVGTTGQRPTAATGQLRFNSTDGRIEVYNGSEWSAVGATGTGNHSLDTFTGDGSTTAFSLSLSPANENALSVFINGAYQEKGDYSLSGSTLTLDTAPLSGEKISVHTIHGTVHDGTAALNQQFTGNGSTTAFTLNADPGTENNTQVFINGVYQQKTDYTVSGTTLTFDTGLTVGDVVEVNSFTVTNLGSSDQVTEGVSNLYHTSARAISAISAGNLTGLTVDTNVLSVDATNDKVGIGTTSPANPLHVVDSRNYLFSSTADASTNMAGIRLTNSNNNNNWAGLWFGTGSAAGTHWSGIAGARTNSSSTWGTHLSFFTHEDTIQNITQASERMRITSAGNVGIGTTAPADYYADELVVSAPSEGGITIASTATSNVNYLLFADGTSGDAAYRGQLAYNHSNDLMSIVTSGTMDFRTGSSRTERMRIDSSGQLQFDSGFGSSGKAYGVRAWVNFNGQSTVAIRDKGNVSSITDHGIGDYTLSFTTAMPDTNYVVSGIGGLSTYNLIAVHHPHNVSGARATGSVRINVVYQNGTGFDAPYVGVLVIR